MAVSVATHGVGDGGEDGERAEQQEQQQAAPAGRADREQGDAEGKRGEDARRQQLPHLPDADRATSGEAARRTGGTMAIGAAHAVAVIVGDIGEDLQRERGQKGEDEDATAPVTLMVSQRIAAANDGERERQGAWSRQFNQGSHVILMGFYKNIAVLSRRFCLIAS